MATDKQYTCVRKMKWINRKILVTYMYKGRSPDMRYVSPQNEENVEGQRGVYAVDYFRGKPV